MSMKIGQKNINGAYVGIGGKAKKIKKVYVGIGGKAKLVYQADNYTYTDFSSLITPTTWTTTTAWDKYATNSYGTWRIYMPTAGSSTTYSVDKGFDNSTSTSIRTTSSSTADRSIYLELPSDCEIKLDKLKAVYQRTKAWSAYGYNSKTQDWEEIASFPLATTSTVTSEQNISSENYYSKFKFVPVYYNSSNTISYIYEIQLLQGTIRIKN